MAKRSNKEGHYGNEFHKGLRRHYRGSLNGSKIHGSVYQKKGLPDYIYYASNHIAGSTFIGAEFKYVPVGKIPKKGIIQLEKLLRPDQKKILYEMNCVWAVGLQATIIEIRATTRVVVITRPRDAREPVLLDVRFIKEELEAGTYKEEGGKLHYTQRILVMVRQTGEPHYNYDLIKSVCDL
jgi:hypothetical protein